MAQTFITIRGIDPLLFRDGKPFTADAGGLNARSLPLPLPSTVAGFIRSQIGKTDVTRNGRPWTEDQCREAHAIPVHGPLLARNGEILLPSPKDALLAEITGDASCACPRHLTPTEFNHGAGCDLPPGMWPLMPSVDERPEGKPPKGYEYWTAADMLTWLAETGPTTVSKIGGLPEEERVGIAIDAHTGTVKESKLYTAGFRSFANKETAGKRVEYSLVAKTSLPNGSAIAAAGTLGGERRLTVLETAPDTDKIWPRCPQTLKDKLGAATQVRMVLATPAHFKHGWLPDWIEHSGSGNCQLPAGIGKVKLELVGAAGARRKPVRGWG
ncbi:MAG: type III-B CRISPR module-associated Cmr3 family protein, partial [Capsulimonadaceae bacterium]